jgi:hypothetical protein
MFLAHTAPDVLGPTPKFSVLSDGERGGGAWPQIDREVYMPDASDLLFKEYEAINGHLRANISQFVNWFSFFMTFSFVALGVVAVTVHLWPQPSWITWKSAVPGLFLFMHMLACAAILTFRNYISATDRRVRQIILDTGATGHSPIPARFCKWMTDLMVAGFLVSYFAWFVLLCFY